jgi:chemotaxis protein MotA
MVPVNVLRSMESTVPAFGMIGTLVGLVSPGSAVALNTTLYGELFSRMILISAANKLQQREEILCFRHEIVIEGFALLAEKRHPRYIQDRVNSFLDPATRFNIGQQMKRCTVVKFSNPSWRMRNG